MRAFDLYIRQEATDSSWCTDFLRAVCCAIPPNNRPPSLHPTALREMNLKYIGSRPVKLRKSDWQDRSLKEVKKKAKTKQAFLKNLGIA